MFGELQQTQEVVESRTQKRRKRDIVLSLRLLRFLGFLEGLEFSSLFVNECESFVALRAPLVQVLLSFTDPNWMIL